MTNADWEEQHWNKPSRATGKRVSSHVTWVTLFPLSNKQTNKQKSKNNRSKPDTILAELPNTVHTCSRHCVVAARFKSERTGSFIPLSKKFPPIGAQSYLQSLCMFLKRTEKCLVARAQCFPPDQFISSHPRLHLAINLLTTIPFTNRSRPLKARFTGNTKKPIKPLLTAMYESG